MELEDLSAAWLTDALREASVLSASRVRDFAAARIGADRGFSARLARVELDYEGPDEGAPRTLVAKCPAFPRELRFYRELAADSGAPVARFCGGREGEILLLEEVAGRPGDAVRGCRTEEASRVLHALARMHAAWWERPRLADLDWLLRLGAEPARAQARHDERLPVFLARYGDRLDGAARRLVERLRPGYGARLAEQGRAPVTLLHRDLHLDNVVFGEGVRFLDWEHPAVGRAAYDVALFVFPAVGAGCEPLLREYHAALAAPGYPYDTFLRHAKEALHVVLGATVNGLARLDPGRGDERQRAWIESVLDPGRLFAAAADMGL